MRMARQLKSDRSPSIWQETNLVSILQVYLIHISKEPIALQNRQMMGTNIWYLSASSQPHANFELFDDEIQAKAYAGRTVILNWQQIRSRTRHCMRNERILYFLHKKGGNKRMVLPLSPRWQFFLQKQSLRRVRWLWKCPSHGRRHHPMPEGSYPWPVAQPLEGCR